MGNVVSAVRNKVSGWIGKNSGKKREYESDSSSDSSNSEYKDVLREPRRKKVKTTEYLYQALYKEGKDSDVTVTALGKSFALHKLYLVQSPYFASIFSSSWSESSEDTIRIEINDPRITLPSLRLVLGALYRDDFRILPSIAISVLATATLLQVDKVIERCAKVMEDNITSKTALKYYYVSCEYDSLSKIKLDTFKWLKLNVMSYYFDNPSELNSFTNDLLEKIMKCVDFIVVENEFSLYLFLRLWMFTKETNNANNIEDIWRRNEALDVSTYFSLREDRSPFLLTPDGEKYIELFKALKLKDLAYSYENLEIIFKDNIFPKDWSDVLTNWYSLLHINDGLYNDPSNLVEDEIFEKACIRIGKYLDGIGFPFSWSVTGFTYGLNLIILCGRYGITLSVTNSQTDEDVVRRIIFRATVVSLDEQRKIKRVKTSELTLEKIRMHSVITLCDFDETFPYEFPMILSLKLLLSIPQEKQLCEESNTRIEEVNPNDVTPWVRQILIEPSDPYELIESDDD